RPPPPRSRAVAWLLLEFPSCTSPPALAGCARPEAHVRDRGQMQRTAAGIGQERAARLDALERASPEWRPWVELLRATFQAAADLAPAPEPLAAAERPGSHEDIGSPMTARSVRLDRRDLGCWAA